MFHEPSECRMVSFQLDLGVVLHELLQGSCHSLDHLDGPLRFSVGLFVSFHRRLFQDALPLEPILNSLQHSLNAAFLVTFQDDTLVPCGLKVLQQLVGSEGIFNSFGRHRVCPHRLGPSVPDHYHRQICTSCGRIAHETVIHRYGGNLLFVNTPAGKMPRRKSSPTDTKRAPVSERQVSEVVLVNLTLAWKHRGLLDTCTLSLIFVHFKPRLGFLILACWFSLLRRMRFILHYTW